MRLNMDIDLTRIGMNKTQQYEAIITTIDKDGKTNAAPFGVRVLDRDKVQLRIFEGGTTIKNIKETEEFVVNITCDPIMFSLSTINTIPEEYLSRINHEHSEFAYITNTDAYFICKAESIKKGLRKDDINSSEINIIKSNVIKLQINNPCTKPINRGIHALIESLVNHSRISIVNEEKREFFLERFKESERMIKKVGSKEEKESIGLLKEDLKNQGFDV